MTISANPQFIDAPQTPTQAPTSDAWQSICRSSLFKLLRRIQRGSLTVREGRKVTTFGSAGQNDEIHATIDIHSPAFFSSIAAGGSLGASESFLAGEWSSPDLVEVLRMLARNRDVLLSVDGRIGFLKRVAARIVNRLNRNSRKGSQRNISAHYDLGNDFFELFLDPTMTYSSGIFESADSTLEQASHAKYERVCRQLDLKPSDHVIEIGTGWGGFALYAARNFGCNVTTTTISHSQHDYTQRLVAESPVGHRVQLLKNDYRDLSGRFDKLVSIEMIEAVGHEYLPGFFRKCSDLLKPNGQMLLQAITIPDQRYAAYRKSTDFIQKYIFPGGCLPSVARMMNVVSQQTDFEISNLFDFGNDYARTLRLWHESLTQQYASVRRLGKDEHFLRAWHYYFAYCEAAFMERQIGVCQILFNKPEYRPAAF